MKTPRGDSQKPENNDDCRALAPFVMTLFDGEADEIEARRARAHLLVCQTCARRWLDWNRSRDLLQSAPVPAPPPQLLWRVLMACRLALTSQRAPKTESAPANFSSQILARTTRTSAPTFPLRRAFSPLKISNLVLPALALCMMILQRDSWMPAPTSSVPIVTNRAPDNSGASRARVSSATPALRRAAPPTREVRASEPASGAIATTQTIPRPVIRAAFRPKASEIPAIRVVAASTMETPRAVTASFDAGFEREMGNKPEAVIETPVVAPVAARRKVVAAVTRAPQRVIAARLTSLSTSDRAPRLRTARWQKASHQPHWNSAPGAGRMRPQPSDASAASPQILRVSLPSASAPQPVRLLAENFDSDDENIEEIRSVVDDFRATLDPDDTADAMLGDEGAS